MEGFEHLRHFPAAGPSREQLAPGLRAMLHLPYVAYYLTTDHELTVVRVLHGARDAAAIAGEGGFIPDD